MNSFRRAITSERKRLLKLSPKSIIQEQHVSFTTPTRTLPTSKSSKPKVPEVRSQPAPTTCSSLNSFVLKEATTWPKPSEIPWQAKVVNSVNLIGQVKIPVQFEASSDGKNWAGTIISQDDGSELSSTSLPSFWIPVIFEDDLAHIAMSHLKEKDYVHVAGHLSVDVPPFKLSEVQANVQVMVHSINFVQNSQAKKISTPGKLDRWTIKNSAILENNVSPHQSSKDLDTMSIQLDLPSEKSTVDVTFKQEKYVQLPNDAKSSPIYNSKGVGRLHSDQKVDKRSVLASWRDLLTNFNQWVDNREKKQKGLVKARYPDFKHKDTGVGLWLDGAPVEILQGLRRLQYSDLPIKDAVSVRSTKDGKGDLWKHLVENPNKWWDNRLDKRNQKAPDFKHKDSGEVLWLGDAPSWALSSLQPEKAKTADVYTKKVWAGNNWSRKAV